jgi:hypothetical protein
MLIDNLLLMLSLTTRTISSEAWIPSVTRLLAEDLAVPAVLLAQSLGSGKGVILSETPYRFPKAIALPIVAPRSELIIALSPKPHASAVSLLRMAPGCPQVAEVCQRFRGGVGALAPPAFDPEH